jgi:peptide deformylase
MQPYNIITAPHKFLSTVCAPVAEKEFGTQRLKDKALRMAITMQRAHGIGLAANQVGILQCIVVINTLTYAGVPDEHGFKGVLINPLIMELGEERGKGSEGCLSFPGETAVVDRHLTITVQYFTTDGERVERKFEGMTARCVQHELDHLSGVTMHDVEG